MVRWSRWWWRGASAPVPPAAPAVVDPLRPWGGGPAAVRPPLAAFDELLVCLWVNDRFADVVQQRRDDLAGQHLGQIDFTLMSDLLPRLQDVLSPGGPDAHLTLDERLDGGCRHWEVACSALQLPERPLGVGLSLTGAPHAPGAPDSLGADLPDSGGAGGVRPRR